MKSHVMVMCALALLATTMPGAANSLEYVSITETWQTENEEGEIIFDKSDGEVTAVSDSGTGFRWGGWMEVNTKGKYPETRLDWDAKADRDGILSDFTDGKFDADGYEGGTHIYTIFSSTGTNVPDMNVPNLETVSFENTKGNDWLGRLTVRDANGDWYLSSLIELPGDGVQTISVAALTWQKIIGETAADMNELDAGGPHAEQLSGSGDGDGPGPLTANVTDPNSTLPDLSAVTGAGFVHAGPAPGPKVWFGPVTWEGFKAPPTAYYAFPAGVVLDSPWASLRWKAGAGVTDETVYFGEDPNNLADVTADVTDNTYALSNLELGKTYYWRVDSTQADGTVLPPEDGNWSFSLADHAVIESFEGFSDKYGNAIFEHWFDGWGFVEPAPGFPGNGTGSTVGYLATPYAEQEIVHGGGVSMPFGYDNSGQNGKKLYSETERTLDAAQDWSGAGGKALTLYFYGDPDNTLGANDLLYVTLEDAGGHPGTVFYHGEQADMQAESWHEWNISLQEFEAVGVDVTQIKKISLGVGDKRNPLSGGSGVLFVDDIRFYATRCVPAFGPEYDTNGDCIIGIRELEIMAGEWLNRADEMAVLANGALITGGYEPNNPNLVEFTDAWDGHSNEDYNAFYVIADENGQPVLEISRPEEGFKKFPRLRTAKAVDFTGATTATIEWKAKRDNSIALFCVANNAHDPFYQFQFVLYHNGVNQILGWAPNDDVDEDPGFEFPSYGPGPTYILDCYQYEDLVTGMDPDQYVTLDLTVEVGRDGVCTVAYAVTQGMAPVASGTLSPTPVRGEGNNRDWYIGSAYGGDVGEYTVGGFVKTCDISNIRGVFTDFAPDGVINFLDFCKIAETWVDEILWP
jgi:hypothetical protein